MELINKNILYIDDDIDDNLKDLLIQPLRDIGFKVHPENDPQEGIDSASHKYGTILIDFKFEGPNSTKQGDDVFREIKSKWPLCTLILVTGKEDSELANMMLIGPDGFISKGSLDSIKSKDLPVYLENKILEAFKLKCTEKNLKRISELECGLHKDLIENRIAVLDKIEQVIKQRKIDGIKNRKVDAVYIAEKASEDFEFVSARKKITKESSMKIGPNTFKSPFYENKKPFEKFALVTLYLIKRYPEKWMLTKKEYPQMIYFIEYFDLS